MGSFLIDTSSLRAFTSIERLDLLAEFQPVYITAAILREHGQAPKHAVDHLDKARKAGQVLILESAPRDAVDKLNEKLGLGVVDCEGILVAERDGLDGIFVADRMYREACRQRKIPTSGVGAVLLHRLRKKTLTKEQVTEVARAMEKGGYFSFPAHERSQLGI